MKDKLQNLCLLVLGSLILILLDQYTKAQAVLHLRGKDPIVLINGVFELYYTENRGAAFGMLQNRQTVFLLISAVVLAAVIFVMWRLPGFQASRYLGLKLCVVLIAAGAIGNMIDRVSQGYVVDFLYFKLIDFPIFNVADIYVTTAAVVLCLLLFFYYREEELEIFRLRKDK